MKSDVRDPDKHGRIITRLLIICGIISLLVDIGLTVYIGTHIR